MLSPDPAALGPALTGVAMGLQFNPLVAAVIAAVAAALVGYRGAPASRVWWAGCLLATGWVVGDGISVAAGVGPGPDGLMLGAAWIATGLVLGYLVPALVGAAVGRSVFHGTGWLAAAAVAVMLSPAIWALCGRASLALWAASA